MRDHIEAGYYYIPGLTGQGTPNNPYTIDDTYTIIDDSAYTSSNALWGWYKGKVSSLSNMITGAGYMQNVVLTDEGGTHSINAYRIWKYDGATTNESFLSLDDEVLFYGSAYVYNNAPSFGSGNITVLVNDNPINGLNETNVASATQFNMIRQAGYSGALYVDGTLSSYSYNDQTSRYQVTIAYRHNNIYNYPYDAVQFSVELTQEQITAMTDGVRMIFVDNEEARTSALVDIDNHGTINNPLSVTEALALAQSNGQDSGVVNPVYCRGIVTRIANEELGNEKDIGSVYIKDLSNDNEIMIYYLKKCKGANASNGLNFTSVADLPIGTEIVIYGKPYNYNGNILEFSFGTYCVAIGGRPVLHQGIDNATSVSTFVDFLNSYENLSNELDWSNTYLKGRIGSITEENGAYNLQIFDLSTNGSITAYSVTLGEGIDSIAVGDIVTIGGDSQLDNLYVARKEAGHNDSSTYIVVTFNNGQTVYFDVAYAGVDQYSGNTQYTGTFLMYKGASFVFVYNGQVVTPNIEMYSFGGSQDNPNAYQAYIVLENGSYVLQQDFVNQAFTFYLKVDGSGNVVSVYISFAEQTIIQILQGNYYTTKK